MPRTYKKVSNGRPYATGHLENLEKALQEIKSSKLSIRAAASKYGIDKMKLHRSLHGKHTKSIGGQTVLSAAEEEALRNRLITASEWGFPFTSYEIRLLVKCYFDRQGRVVKQFRNNMPGEDWVKSFLERKGQILSVRLGKNIKRCRAAVSPAIINNYFDNLEKTLAGVKPENIINYDETNLSDDPGRKRVVVKRGCKHPEFVMNSSKASTSLMMACAGDGTLLPPFIIHRSLHLWDSWTNGGPKGARYANTKSGWIDLRTFEEWFRTIALPYLKTKDGPRAIIADNLSSHLSAFVIDECQVHDIRFILLPKNSTHLCQPLDVSFFRPFKRHWRDILFDWKLKGNRGTIPKDRFPIMLKKLLTRIEETAPGTIKSGFEKTGIVPLNRKKVLDQIPSDDNGDTRTHIGTDMQDSFVEVLKTLRYGTSDNRTTNKISKRAVQPGKSVANMESDVSSSSDETSSDLSNLPGQDDEEEHVDEPEATSFLCDHPAYEDLNEGDFVTVEMAAKSSRTKESKKQFVGKVVSVSETSSGETRVVEVKFMRRYKDSFDTFVWPPVEDRSFVYPHEVKRRLPHPTEVRYGRLKFDVHITC